MQLDRRQRLRVAVMRPLSRRMLASPRLRRYFLARAQASLDEGLDPDLAILAGLDARTGDSEVAKRTPAQVRRHMRTSVAIVDDPGTAHAVTTRELTVAGAVGPRPARAYVPEGLAAPSAAIVFFHGGGWVTGDLDTHDGLCRKLAALGRVRVIAVDYRLAPEHAYPAAADDAIAAFRDVSARADELGVRRDRVGVAGDSAGGNLSAVVALATRRDAHPPALQALLYPAVDLTCGYPSHQRRADAFILNARAIAWYRAHYLGPSPSAERLREPLLSPLCAADLAGVAPAYVLTAAFDSLHDEGVAYAERLRAAGVAVTARDEAALVHGFLVLTRVSPACARATDAICTEVGALLAR